jgi:hypothetical protein
MNIKNGNKEELEVTGDEYGHKPVFAFSYHRISKIQAFGHCYGPNGKR